MSDPHRDIGSPGPTPDAPLASGDASGPSPNDLDPSVHGLLPVSRTFNPEAIQLVEEFQPEALRIVRAKRAAGGVWLDCDSMGLYQSMAIRFLTAVDGQDPILADPRQVRMLLRTILLHRLRDLRRRAMAARRDGRRNVGGLDQDRFPDVRQTDSPSRVLVEKEKAARIFQRLKPIERQIAERLCAGLTYEEIGLALGRSAEAVRKQWDRARGRIKSQLASSSTVGNASGRSS